MNLLSRSRRSDLTPFERMRNEFERALTSLWHEGWDPDEIPTSDWAPRIDVAETDESIDVKVDVPGIDPKDVDVSLTDKQLTIKGKREEEKETKDKTFHRVERTYGSFCRRINLPTAIDAEKISATADKGVITVSVPKQPEAKPKAIPVKPK